MTRINALNWIKTKFYLRIIRATIGAALAYLIINKLFYNFESWYISMAIPYFLVGFIFYGPYILLCSKLKLITESNEEEDEPLKRQGSSKRALY